MTQEASLNTPLKQNILKNVLHFCSRPWNLIKGKPFSNNPHTHRFFFFKRYQIRLQKQNLGLGLPPVLLS